MSKFREKVSSILSGSSDDDSPPDNNEGPIRVITKVQTSKPKRGFRSFRGDAAFNASKAERTEQKQRLSDGEDETLKNSLSFDAFQKQGTLYTLKPLNVTLSFVGRTKKPNRFAEVICYVRCGQISRAQDGQPLQFKYTADETTRTSECVELKPPLPYYTFTSTDCMVQLQYRELRENRPEKLVGTLVFRLSTMHRQLDIAHKNKKVGTLRFDVKEAGCIAEAMMSSGTAAAQAKQVAKEHSSSPMIKPDINVSTGRRLEKESVANPLSRSCDIAYSIESTEPGSAFASKDDDGLRGYGSDPNICSSGTPAVSASSNLWAEKVRILETELASERITRRQLESDLQVHYTMLKDKEAFVRSKEQKQQMTELERCKSEMAELYTKEKSRRMDLEDELARFRAQVERRAKSPFSDSEKPSSNQICTCSKKLPDYEATQQQLATVQTELQTCRAKLAAADALHEAQELELRDARARLEVGAVQTPALMQQHDDEVLALRTEIAKLTAQLTQYKQKVLEQRTKIQTLDATVQQDRQRHVEQLQQIQHQHQQELANLRGSVKTQPAQVRQPLQDTRQLVGSNCQPWLPVAVKDQKTFLPSNESTGDDSPFGMGPFSMLTHRSEDDDSKYQTTLALDSPFDKMAVQHEPAVQTATITDTSSALVPASSPGPASAAAAPDATLAVQQMEERLRMMEKALVGAGINLNLNSAG